MKAFGRIAAALLLTLVALPTFAQAKCPHDFTNFVAIGDSYGAGYESGSLNERHQMFSWPAVIARQLGKNVCVAGNTATDNCFAVPLVAYPGISPELQVVDLTKFPPTILPAGTTNGAPFMTTFGRPYNNLSIPGATVADVTKVTGKENPPTRGVEQLAQFILRGLGTEVQQAAAQHPTTVAIWIGGNDFLGAATSGTPALLTPTAAFSTAYNAMLDQLIAGAPSTGIVVGTLPENFAAVPFLRAPYLTDSTGAPVLGPDGNKIYFIADLGGGKIGQLTEGSAVLLPYASKTATGVGLPKVPPFSALPNAGTPFADTETLTADEIAAIKARVVEYNNVITQAATSRGIPVADIRGLFDRVMKRQEFVGPFSITPDYITGGFFSLDGVHLTDLGYILFANEYIRAMNSCGNDIPFASVQQIFANNGSMFGASTTSGVMMMPGTPWEMSVEAANVLRDMPITPHSSKSNRFRTGTTDATQPAGNGNRTPANN